LDLDAGLHDVEIFYWDQAGRFVFDLQLKDSTGTNIWVEDNLSRPVDDALTTYEDVPITINVIGNDTDVDGDLDPASLVLQTNPANGVVTINADGTVLYTPNANYTGVDSFTYTVGDTAGNTSNEATVTVAVTALSNSAVYGDGDANIMVGDSGADTLVGGAGNDVLRGAGGSDLLIGGTDDDIFLWQSGDEGTVVAPVSDRVADFHMSESDVLKIGDLLSGVTGIEDGAALDNYLHFEQSGNDVVISVNTTGSGGSYDEGSTAFDAGVTQTITLENTQMSDIAGGGITDAQIIDNLLSTSHLDIT